MMPLASNQKKTLDLLPAMSNRHGLIAGATGTGKTVTLKVVAEALSRRGVCVFMADVKGDLSGLAAPGAPTPPFLERLKKLELKTPSFEGFPVVFWDPAGVKGHPVRTTVSELGPLLLSRLLDLNDTQSGVLNAVFEIADRQGLLLLDLKDLKAMLQNAAENSAEYRAEFGLISSVTVGAIQRNILALESQGADQIFGEPALSIRDWLSPAADGRGRIHVLNADKLIESPRSYATLLLWLLSELFEELPEAGDLPQPKLVFFFDEAHLLFKDAPKALLEKIEQVVRLIRSRGVGIFFVTQNPLDIPESVLGQLGNRVQHALRAFTPRDQKSVRAAAQTFRPNPGVDVEAAIQNLAVGEALVSLLDEAGTPAPVERAWILPPASRFGPLDEVARSSVMSASEFGGRYDHAVDRESAFEVLRARKNDAPPAAPIARPTPADQRPQTRQPAPRTAYAPRRAPVSTTERIAKDMATSAARSIGTQIGRQIIRGVLGSIFGSGGRR